MSVIFESPPTLKREYRSGDQDEPTWEVALLFPRQGMWSESDYLTLDERCEGTRIELVSGYLEVLPMPTEFHQTILMFLYESLKAFARQYFPGKILLSGLRVRVREKPLKIREPDLAYMKKENAHRRQNKYWEGADLVMEIVSGSPEDRKRDYEEKVQDYGDAGIPEYWIVDPEEKRIRVLTLKGKEYEIHGDFGPGSLASSVLLPGYQVSVDAALRGED